MLNIGTLHFYPRSPCGERPRKSQSSRAGIRISIHALLAESDRGWCFISAFPQTFLSTLSLRRATQWFGLSFLNIEFLSTLSLRRATLCRRCCYPTAGYFYPRSPCGERLLHKPDGAPLPLNISIHALLAESDFWVRSFLAPFFIFLSTLSLRRATHCQVREAPRKIISIHALLAESDSKSAQNSGALLRI